MFLATYLKWYTKFLQIFKKSLNLWPNKFQIFEMVWDFTPKRKEEVFLDESDSSEEN
jgi:hypothetical protein